MSEESNTVKDRLLAFYKGYICLVRGSEYDVPLAQSLVGMWADLLRDKIVLPDEGVPLVEGDLIESHRVYNDDTDGDIQIMKALVIQAYRYFAPFISDKEVRLLLKDMMDYSGTNAPESVFCYVQNGKAHFEGDYWGPATFTVVVSSGHSFLNLLEGGDSTQVLHGYVSFAP